MASLDGFRAIDVPLDFANDHVPPVTVSSEDSGGRALRVTVTNGGASVSPDGITARLLYNPDPGGSGESGGYVTMSNVAGAATATFTAPLPAISYPAGRLAVELTDSAGTTVSRTIEALVERPVLAMDRASGQDALREFRAAVQTLGDVKAATTAANSAAQAALDAANKLGVPVYFLASYNSALPSGARTPCVIFGADGTIGTEDGK